jgi:hypothetical protein
MGLLKNIPKLVKKNSGAWPNFFAEAKQLNSEFKEALQLRKSSIASELTDMFKTSDALIAGPIPIP